MTIAIPVWLLWTLGGIAAVVGVAIVVFLLAFAWFGWSIAHAIGSGLKW